MCSGHRKGCLCAGLAVMLKGGTALTHTPLSSTHIPPTYPSHTLPLLSQDTPPFLIHTPAPGLHPGQFPCCPPAYPCPFVFLAPTPSLVSTAACPSPLPS